MTSMLSYLQLIPSLVASLNLCCGVTSRRVERLLVTSMLSYLQLIPSLVASLNLSALFAPGLPKLSLDINSIAISY